MKNQKLFLDLSRSIYACPGDYPDEQIEFTIRELEKKKVVILTTGTLELAVRLKDGEVEVVLEWYEDGYPCRDVDRYKSIDNWLAECGENLDT